MNNLPTTFDGLLKLLYEMREKYTEHNFNDPNYDVLNLKLLGKKLDILLSKYDAKEKV